MVEFHKIWIAQCDAAQGIQESFGTEKALGYLIGEKLVNFIRAADQHPEFAAELPEFIAEIRRIFTPADLRVYLEGIRRVGAFAHVCTDEEYEDLQATGAFEEDAVGWAEDVVIVERIKGLLFA